MPTIFITRAISESGIDKLKKAGYEVDINPDDRVLGKDELINTLKNKKYDAVLCLLTDKIDRDIFEAVGTQCKIFANYAVGYDNIDINTAKEKNILITNTPGVLTETVAEHTFALMLAISHRIAEADRFTKNGNYKGWEPTLLLGNDLSHKTVGIVGAGRIGSRVAYHASRGFDANIIYYDIKRNEEFEKETGARYCETLDNLLGEADYVSIHVPLLPQTKHLINKDKFSLMKKSAYLINTSRGPVIDEEALVVALKTKAIRGAALDVFEDEPRLKEGLSAQDNVILTPHIASGTEETRSKMSEMAANNIISALNGETPPQLVNVQ